MTTALAVDRSLEQFFERLRDVNPFLDNRVNGLGGPDCDADAVHPHALDRLIDLAGQALAARRGLGAVVWGEAGIGKSHLLARLGRWAAVDHHATFVYLHNLQATPEHLPRTLLRHVVTVLARGRRHHFHQTPLFGLIHAGVGEAVGERTSAPSWNAVRQRYNAFVDRLAHDDHLGAAGFDRSIYDVLFHFFEAAYRARTQREDTSSAEMAVRWLAGQTLELHEAYTLGLPAPRRHEDPVALEDAQQIKQVLVALSRLAASNQQPFILAFDQVDNLDNDQFAALSRFLEALLDSAPNLLVVTAGVRASLERWREHGVVQHSAWDRLAQFDLALQRLNVEQAAQLIRARLDPLLAPFANLEAVQRRRREDALFPLGNNWFRRQFHDRKDLRPRDVINWAREGWRAQQDELRRLGGVAWLSAPTVSMPPPPPQVIPELTEKQRRDLIDQFLDRRLEELRTQPVTLQNLPADAEHIAGLFHALLKQCRDDANFAITKVEPVLRVNGQPPTYSLQFAQQADSDAPLSTGVLVLTAPKPANVTPALKRLVQNLPKVQRFVLMTDERIGLPLAEKGKNYFDKVALRFAPHFQHVELSVADYAAMQALQTVVLAARSGDVEIGRRSGEALRVSEAEVIASHHRRGRYRAARVLMELLAPLPEAVAPAAGER